MAISNADEKNLDRYEGWPSFYVKENIEFAYIGDRPGRRAKGIGMAYIMPPEKSKLGLPTKPYFDGILEGYERFGLDVKILYEALRYSE